MCEPEMSMQHSPSPSQPMVATAPGAVRKTTSFDDLFEPSAPMFCCGYVPAATWTIWPGGARRCARAKLAHGLAAVQALPEPFGATNSDALRAAVAEPPARVAA